MDDVNNMINQVYCTVVVVVEAVMGVDTRRSPCSSHALWRWKEADIVVCVIAIIT